MLCVLVVSSWLRISIAQTSSPYARTTFVTDIGPGEVCGLDFCNVSPLGHEFAFNDVGPEYNVIVTVTLSYRTSKDESASIQALLSTGSETPRRLQPGAQALPDLTDPSAVTIRWRANGLAAGTTYRLELMLQGTSGIQAHRVRSENVLATIEAVPSTGSP